MHSTGLKILLILLLFSVASYAQKSKMPLQPQPEKTVFPGKRERLIGDSIFFFVLAGACKNKAFSIYKKTMVRDAHADNQQQEKPALLSIHGNILYNFNYRSYIDTPFQQNGLVQHTVQTYMDGTVADKYPFRAILTYRGSNSPYFSNSSSISVQYRQSDMLEKIKKDLRKDADSSLDKRLLASPSQKYSMGQVDRLADSAMRSEDKGLYKIYDSLYAQYAAKRKQLEALEKKAGNHNLLQAIIEEREAKLFGKLKSSVDTTGTYSKLKNYWSSNPIESRNQGQQDSISKTPNNKDSTASSIRQTQDSIAALQKEVAADEKKILFFQKKLSDSVLSVKKNINQLSSPESVDEYIDKNDTTEKNRLTQVQKILLSVNQIGIGRSWVNYSELTVQNVSLNGFNIEMNPGNIYVASAIGSVNSQFRDFILNNNTSVNQSVKLFRIGIGKKDKDNFIFTMYNGRKAMLNTTGIGDSSATQPIVGASLATTRIIDKNITATAEFARSSYADAYAPGQESKGLVNRVFNFKMKANQAWDIKFKANYPLTNTKIDGDYKQMGEAFQSFTIYATNVKQDAFLFHANQLLWKKKLTIDASVRKDDFNSPLTAPGYSNTAVFKSLQVSLAIPRYPFVSLGYYPSSQLFVGSNNIVYQSWYSTLNAITSYTYKLAKLNMATNAVYTKFYNNQSDSGFIYFNASTFTLNHTVYLKPFTLQGNFTISNQDSIHLKTLEPVVSYQYKNILTLTGSVKWSRLNGVQTLWGDTGGISVMLKHLGTIQLHYDKVYLPAYNNTLKPVDMGRITFNRVF
jgi:hypothetical protein